MDSGEFSQRVRDLLRDRDMSVRAVARHLNYDHAYLSRVLSGKQHPSTQLVTALDNLFKTNGELAEIATRIAPPTDSPEAGESPAIIDRILRLNEARGADFAQAIRETSHRLVVLDNELSGVSIAEPAGRAFKVVHRRLGAGDYDPRHERDIQSAAAEPAQPGRGVATGYASMSSARLAQCLLDVNAWRDAEGVIRSLVTAAPGISSGRTLRLIGHVAEQRERLNGAPTSLTDTLAHLSGKLDEDPFTL